MRPTRLPPDTAKQHAVAARSVAARRPPDGVKSTCGNTPSPESLAKRVALGMLGAVVVFLLYLFTLLLMVAVLFLALALSSSVFSTALSLNIHIWEDNSTDMTPC